MPPIPPPAFTRHWSQSQSQKGELLVASTVGCEVGLAGHRRDW